MNKHMTSMTAVLRRRVPTLAVAVGLVLALAASASGSTRTGQPAAGGAGAGPPPASASTLHGTWKLLPAAPAPELMGWYLVGVWTGHEMIIHDLTSDDTAPTFAYRPASNTWATLASSWQPQTQRGKDYAVWTGSEMLVLGPPTWGAYNPATNTWRLIPPAGFRFPWDNKVLVWTGHEAIVWGGTCCSITSHDGRAYNPATNHWRRLPTAPLQRRQRPMGAWTGKELIVAGGTSGSDNGKLLNTAAAYNPATNTWRKLPPMPRHRVSGTGVWDGKEVLFLGPWQRGMAYNPATNHWRMLPAMPYISGGFAAVWTGRHVLVWGGLPYGEAYDPATNRWSLLPKAPLQGRYYPVAVWTGHTMIVWGGSTGDTVFQDGAVFRPRTP